jgi:hypothetical protein
MVRVSNRRARSNQASQAAANTKKEAKRKAGAPRSPLHAVNVLCPGCVLDRGACCAMAVCLAPMPRVCCAIAVCSGVMPWVCCAVGVLGYRVLCHGYVLDCGACTVLCHGCVLDRDGCVLDRDACVLSGIHCATTAFVNTLCND